MLHCIIHLRNGYKVGTMKKLLFLIVAAFCLLACKKDQPVSPGLFGKWELRRMYGGLYYRDFAFAAGNGTLYQFNTDSTYKYFIKGELKSQGVFHYRKHSILIGDAFYDALILNDTVPATISYDNMVKIKGTTLTLGTTITDGIASDYQKVSN